MVWLEDEAVWLFQQLIAELFQVTKSSISEHIKHIFEEGELMKEETVRDFRTVQKEGVRSAKSHTVTRFQQSATLTE